MYFQGHAAPGIYARAFLEGRLDEEQLEHFRMELQDAAAGTGGLSSYPHPRLMPDFWEFPTVSMGLGPLNAIYQAHFNRYLHHRGIADTSASRVWCFLGDGECDEPETLGALSLAGREQLDNLIFVVNCNLQRLDGPVRGNGKIIQELEATFRGAGWNVIKVVWGSQVGRAAGPRRRRRPAQQDEHHRRRRVPEVRDRGRRLHPGALLRARPPAAQAWSSTSPTTTSAACPAGATTTASCTPPTRRPPRQPASPPSSWPRPSRAGRSAPRSRPATPPTRSRR